MKYLIKSADKIFLFIALFFVFIIYSVIAVSSHNHFQTFGWDLGYFDQIIWKLSNLDYPFSTLNKVNFLANHFSPVLIFNALTYRIWPDARILLFAQAFVMVAASIPLYLLSLEQIKNKLLSFTLVFSYLFFLGTQWSILNEFHETTYLPLFLALFFFSIKTAQRNLFLAISIIGILCTKEEFSLLLAALGIPVYFYYKRKKLGLFLFGFGTVFFFFLTGIFMTFISEKGVYQHAHLAEDAKTPVEFIVKLIRYPYFLIQAIFTPLEKIKTFIITLASFAFIPLLAPFSILVPILEQFLMRFLYSGPQYTVWQNVNHHAAPIAILLPIACIFSVERLIKLHPGKKNKIIFLIAFLLIVSTIYQDIAFKAPIHSIFKSALYRDEGWMQNARTIINNVPKDVPIATQNSLFPHLSQRDEIYLLPEIRNAQFIAVDLHDGPNKYAPLNKQELVSLLEDELAKRRFEISTVSGEAMLLKRIEN